VAALGADLFARVADGPGVRRALRHINEAVYGVEKLFAAEAAAAEEG
jgi:hypothetical protein